MESTNIPVVQGAWLTSQVMAQFVAFAEDQGGPLLQAVRGASKIPDVRDRIDEYIWQFKVHAPQGYTLDAVTGGPVSSHYSWIAMVHDH
jgi:hypothetical protein